MNQRNEIRLILFDADKTLYDISTDEAYAKTYALLSKELGIPAKQLKKEHEEEIAKIKNLLDPIKREYQYTLEKLIVRHTTKSKELVKQAYALFWDTIIENLSSKTEAKKTLEYLSKNYILAVATDEFYSIVDRKLNRIFGNWKEYFHTIISSDRVNTMKPSVAYYEEALSQFKMSSTQVVMVGDSWKRDLEPAKKLGITTILISDKKEGSPDFHFQNLKELRTLF